jgi:beta-glucosidase-like glycosyl hydrolase
MSNVQCPIWLGAHLSFVSISAPGEDPHLTIHYVKAYIAGLQQPMATSSSSASTGNPNPRMQMAAGCKHLVANSLESWGHVSRHTFNAHVSEPDLRNYYFPPFQECAKQSLGVMCSYNAVNGVPACVNNWLLQDVLRDEWNFTGYIVTDCGALEDVVTGHHYAISQVQAASMASHASVDITCSDTLFLRQAHQEGWIAQDEIRDSFRRLARVQMQLGLFDNPKESFAAQDDIQVIDSPAHQQLALEAALQSIVLLQNRHQTLPLGPNIPRLAVMGPHVQATEALLSNYHGSKCGCNDHNNNNQHPFDCIETPLQAIAKANSHHGVYQQAETTGLLGCHVADTKYNDIENAIKLAKRSDVVILMVGLDQSQEREGLDRIETTLPGLQQELIMAVLKAQPFKTVIVLVNGGALSLGQDILDRAPVIVEASYGGQAASRALAQVLFGDYNPTGRLAATMYPPAYVHEIPMTEMGVSVGVGRTHRHYQGVAEFEFGHGLSYSQWQLQVEQEDVELLDTGLTEDTSDASITLDVRVTNLGPYPSSQTVLLFWRPMEAQVDILQKLIRFDQTTLLAVGESQVLSLPVQLQDFALYNQAQVYVNATVVPGMYHLEARVANGCKVTTRAWIRQAPTQDIQL